jgi:hypothetical protein
MGKGKGKLNSWFSKCNSGSIVIETKNVRPGRTFFFYKQLIIRFFTGSKIIINKRIDNISQNTKIKI